MRVLIAGFVALAMAMANVSAASAQSTGDDSSARAHFQSGQGYFDTGRYEDSVREFLEAYRLSQRPALLYNIYIAYERLGDLDHAIEYLERYLRDEREIPNRANLGDRLANLERRRDAARAEAAAAASAASSAASASAASSTTPDEPAPSRRFPLGATISFAAAGAGVVIFATAGGLALAEDRSLDDTCGTTCTEGQVKPLRRRTLVADIGLGTAAAGAVSGLVLWLVQRDDDDRPRVSVGATPENAFVEVRGRF